MTTQLPRKGDTISAVIVSNNPRAIAGTLRRDAYTHGRGHVVVCFEGDQQGGGPVVVTNVIIFQPDLTHTQTHGHGYVVIDRMTGNVISSAMDQPDALRIAREQDEPATYRTLANYLAQRVS